MITQHFNTELFRAQNTLKKTELATTLSVLMCPQSIRWITQVTHITITLISKYVLKENYTLWRYEVYLIVEKRFHEWAVLAHEIFFPLKKKYIFALPCNILYLLNDKW